MHSETYLIYKLGLIAGNDDANKNFWSLKNAPTDDGAAGAPPPHLTPPPLSASTDPMVWMPHDW